MAILFTFPGYESLAESIRAQCGYAPSEVVVRQFPDGETFVKLNTDVKNQDIIVVCGLDNADQKAMGLMFFAEAAKNLGAKSVGLISPYLGYMRQDKRFHEGEAITSNLFAKFLSSHVDWLVTIDPHLHRHKLLSEIYSIPSKALHATDNIVEWILSNVENPVLIGPDEESEQWVSNVANKLKAPYTILTKIRHGDEDVEVSVPDVHSYKEHTPVLIDDIISTARTMIETVKHVQDSGLPQPVCIGIHAIFAGNAYEDLKSAGPSQIVTCNTIPHPSNQIDVSGLLAQAIKEM